MLQIKTGKARKGEIMSHWAKIPCKYKDAESLTQALQEIYGKDAVKSGNHDRENWYGSHYGKVSCDISAIVDGSGRWVGFKKNNEGFFEMILDDHFKHLVNMKNLSRAYAENLIRNKFRGKFSVSSQKDGEIKLRKIGA